MTHHCTFCDKVISDEQAARTFNPTAGVACPAHQSWIAVREYASTPGVGLNVSAPPDGSGQVETLTTEAGSVIKVTISDDLSSVWVRGKGWVKLSNVRGNPGRNLRKHFGV